MSHRRARFFREKIKHARRPGIGLQHLEIIADPGSPEQERHGNVHVLKIRK